jgi:hypothetical protein
MHNLRNTRKTQMEGAAISKMANLMSINGETGNFARLKETGRQDKKMLCTRVVLSFTF